MNTEGRHIRQLHKQKLSKQNLQTMDLLIYGFQTRNMFKTSTTAAAVIPVISRINKMHLDPPAAKFLTVVTRQAEKRRA